ncbi:MAG: HAD hydrolase-like protein [Desulfarculus sp.]|nr:HAD hydrolase-like protein [Desulfarculus sp.]
MVTPAGRLRALIFDFDGTLAELNIDFLAMRRGVEALARDRGFHDPWPAGGYLLEQVAEVSARLGNGYGRQALDLIEAVELEAAGRGRLFDFTRPLLARAGRTGLAVAIISRNCGPAIRRVFPDIASYCRAFLPREAAPRVKPDPGHPLAALAALGVGSEAAALIGDHPVDIQTARAAGCRAVGVASGRVDRAGLLAAGADLALDNAADLLEALAVRGWLEG